jgi:hypothetical protein
MALLSGLAIACSSAYDDGEAAPQETSTAQVAAGAPTAATATSAPPATPTATAGYSTGVAAIDNAIAAVEKKDAAALTSQAHLEALMCTTMQGLGGPPACRPGETPGTRVNVLYTASCDGHYVRRDGVDPLMTRFVEDKATLAGVYWHNGLTFPSSQYVVLYSFETAYGTLARALFVSDPGIVGVVFGCGTSAGEFIKAAGLTEAILLPGG